MGGYKILILLTVAAAILVLPMGTRAEEDEDSSDKISDLLTDEEITDLKRFITETLNKMSNSGHILTISSMDIYSVEKANSSTIIEADVRTSETDCMKNQERVTGCVANNQNDMVCYVSVLHHKLYVEKWELKASECDRVR